MSRRHFSGTGVDLEEVAHAATGPERVVAGRDQRVGATAADERVGSRVALKDRWPRSADQSIPTSKCHFHHRNPRPLGRTDD